MAVYSAIYAAQPQPKHTDEPLFLLHCGQIDSGGEQGDWDIEADSGKRVDEFCRLHPGQTINLHPHVQSPAPAPEPVAMRYDFDGYGWKYIDNGSGSDWMTRHPDGELLYDGPCAAVGAWQPIETAPKDGRKLILFYLNRNGKARTVMACWVTDEEAAETDAHGVGLKGGWYEHIDNWDEYSQVTLTEGEPSHWMPLPANPALHVQVQGSGND